MKRAAHFTLTPAEPATALGRGWAKVKSVLVRFRPPRRLKLTREGKYFILITFGVGFVGILTANNLLYVLLGILLSLIVVSGLLSEDSLNKLRVTRKLPLRAQVGRPHLVEIEVHNDKKRMPSYAIEVEDLRAGQPADKRCFFLKVSSGSSQVAAYRRVPNRRGLDQHVGFRVATRFPFGFFEKSRELSRAGDLIIYPAVDPVHLPRPVDGRLHLLEGTSMRRGSGDDIWGLRAMREGDDPRDIYWKRSTARGPKVVMERAMEMQSRVHLYLDNLHEGTRITQERSQIFERHVREVASYAVAHLRRGEPVTITATSGAVHAAHPSEGADSTLRFLALIELEDHATPGIHNIHLAQEGAGPRKAQQSLVMAPVQLSRPASEMTATMTF
ncbi:MAG TPA: DUF58 domain-containing protein, partial [Polyangiaceae bacterium]|nr:DUF58 domain-containing protein [Polyangiaceae bacterium]